MKIKTKREHIASIKARALRAVGQFTVNTPQMTKFTVINGFFSDTYTYAWEKATFKVKDVYTLFGKRVEEVYVAEFDGVDLKMDLVTINGEEVSGQNKIGIDIRMSTVETIKALRTGDKQ